MKNKSITANAGDLKDEGSIPGQGAKIPYALWPRNQNRELKPGLCNSLEGWGVEGDGREVQEGGDICILMADSC